MEKVINVAQYIFDRYKIISGETIDEMKLHKLLYFVQRESFAIVNKPLFQGDFEGWKYGPVCVEVRKHYTRDGLGDKNTQDISLENKYIIDNIISQYGELESWKLSQITHRETSWLNSRKGVVGNGNKKLLLEDIKKDSEKVRPYDSVCDMYWDEFEDATEEEIGIYLSNMEDGI